MISFFAPAAFAVGALVQNRIADQNVQLAEMEFEQLIGAE
jgi:hypothetical protein